MRPGSHARSHVHRWREPETGHVSQNLHGAQKIRSATATEIRKDRNKPTATRCDHVINDNWLEILEDVMTDVDWNSSGGAPAVADRTLASRDSNP